MNHKTPEKDVSYGYTKLFWIFADTLDDWFLNNIPKGLSLKDVMVLGEGIKESTQALVIKRVTMGGGDRDTKLSNISWSHLWTTALALSSKA